MENRLPSPRTALTCTLSPSLQAVMAAATTTEACYMVNCVKSNKLLQTDHCHALCEQLGCDTTCRYVASNRLPEIEYIWVVYLLEAYLLPNSSETASSACSAPAVAAAVRLPSWQGLRPQTHEQTRWSLAQLSTERQYSSSALQSECKTSHTLLRCTQSIQVSDHQDSNSLSRRQSTSSSYPAKFWLNYYRVRYCKPLVRCQLVVQQAHTLKPLDPTPCQHHDDKAGGCNVHRTT